MTKKIFAIIGIVCGSVAVFCGAVFGVMALMGKFKTPIIYPTILSFEHEEITVIEGAVFDTAKELSVQDEKPTIHEFKLVGLNPDYDRPVNQTECYVWFKNSEGPKLITLCDVNGTPLQANQNKYLVHCNQPIYFMVNKIADDGIIDSQTNKVTDGVAILEARSVNDTLKKPDSPLSIYIDREVEAVYVIDKSMFDKPNMGNSTYNTQDITIGTDMDLSFEYKVITELSHRPIQAENAKEIELYFDATGIGADYIPVTQEEISNSSSPLYGLIRYENDKFILNGASAGNYNFIVAVFPTYQSKIDYEAEVAGQTVQYPYVHRVSAMLQTKLSVEVQEISISSLTFKRNPEALIHLYLYAQDDYINLDGADDLIENAKNNSLGAQLWLEDGLIEDVTRLDGFKFVDFTNENLWYGENYAIGFISSNRTEEFVGSSVSSSVKNNYSITLTNKGDESETEFTIVKSNLQLADGLTVIDYIEAADETRYYSSKSWVVLDETVVDSPKIRLLRPGNYLNFYIKTTNGYIVATTEQFDYEINAVDGLYGKEKSWQIVSKTIPNLEDGESLVLGAFVVNGTFTSSLADDVDKYFEYVGIQVDVQELEYEVKSLTNTLDVNFTATEVKYGDKAFDDIIDITGGSYTAGVFVVAEDDKDKVQTLIVDGTEPNVIYEDNNDKYYVVGYLDRNGNFQNKVKLSGDWNKNDTLNLKMLMLQNAYDKTTEWIMETLELPSGEDKITINKAQLVNNLTIEVKANYILNTDLMSVKVWKPDGTEAEIQNGKYEFYECQLEERESGNVIEVLSSNTEMLTMVKNFYASDPDITAPAVSFNSGSITVKIVNKTEGSWCYEITRLVGENDEFIGTIDCGGTFTLPTIKVLSGRPGSLVFNTAEVVVEDRTRIDLFSSTMSAETANTYLQLEISYNEGYVYMYSLVEGGVETSAELTEVNIFNKQISSPLDSGFQSKEDKQQTYAVNYLTHKGVLSIDENGVKALKIGVEILEVNVAGTVGYIKVVVTSDLTLEPESKNHYTNTEEITPTLEYLGVKIKYVDAQGGTQTVTLSKNKDVFVKDVVGVGYQVEYSESNDSYTIYEDKNNNNECDSDETTYLIISNDETNGWTFSRQATNINIKVKFTVVTILGNVNCEVNFSSSVAVGINDVWAERNIYAGTKVVLGNNTPYSLLNFKDTTNSNDKFYYSINGGATKTDIDLSTPNTITPDAVGTLDLWIYYGDVVIRDDLTFSVLPNVIATPIENKKLTSGSSCGISELFTLQAYDIGIEYGLDESRLYKNENNLVDLVNTDPEYDNLSIVGDESSEAKFTWEDSQLKVGDMQNLNGIKKVVTLKYEDNTVLEHEFEVEHKFTADIENFEPNDDGFYLYKVNKNYNPTIQSGYKLISVTHNAQEGEDKVEFGVSDGMFIVDKTITQSRTINVTFVLQNGANEDDKLIYTNDITLTPYTPELKTLGDDDIAYSGAEYDILNKLYTVEDFNKDIIYSLKVNRFLDEQGTNITSQIVDNFVPSGFVNGVAGSHCEVVFKDFAKDELIVDVEFVVQYQDGQTYTYYKQLTIKNRQSLIVQYPEMNLGGEQRISFIFDEKYTSDARELLKKSTKVKVEDFEPILVYTNADVSIDFTKQDEAKNVVRATIDNRDGDADTNLKIEVIAYESEANGAAVNKEKISVNGSVLTISNLGATQTDFAAYYILKLSTNSTNCKYYFIRLYCTNLTVSASNNIDVVAYQTGDQDSALKTDDTKAVVSADNSIADVLNSESVKNNFKSIFKKEYDDKTTSLWLYNGVETGGQYENVENATPQWSRLDSSTRIQSLINDATKFTTLTIGLMHTSLNSQYVYGTITIYVQPDIDILIANSSLNYEKPNGEFTMNLSNNATVIPVLLTNFSIDEIYIDDVKRSEIKEGNVNYGLLDSDGNIKKRVEEDTIIRVKYKYVNSETFAYVTYTYKATTLPPEQTTSTEVGTYDSIDSIFNNKVNLLGTSLKTKYFKDYEGNYKIYAGSKLLYYTSENDLKYFVNGVEYQETKGSVAGVKIDDGVITFTQTEQQWEIDLRFVYTDFADGKQSRTFRFVVLPCVSVGAADVTGGDGSTMNSPYVTKEANSDMYNKEHASSIEITKEIEREVSKFRIAGFEIRVEETDAVMDITFNEPEFVLGNTVSEGTTIINFPHMATNKIITADIKIKKEDTTYLTKRIYIELFKTYNNLQINYLEDGATHENVIAGEYGNLNSKFITSDNFDADEKGKHTLLTLIGLDGEEVLGGYSLKEMGFATEGNPNKIVYSRGTAMDITGNVLTFYKVDTNTETSIFLNNNAGISKNSLEYKFQIIKDNKEDGLDFTKNDDIQNTDGRLEDGYMSFMMGDDDTTSEFVKTFKLGKMLDERNTTAFNITDLVINNVNYGDINTIKFVDGEAWQNGIKNSDGAFKDIKIFGDVFDAIQYRFSYDENYIFYITLHSNTNQVYLTVQRAAGEDIASQTIKFSLGGVNGEGTILSDFTVYLSAEKVELKSNAPTSVYSYEKIDLKDKVFKETIPSNSQSITYIVAEGGTYGQGKPINADVDNILFSLSNGTILTFKAVGQETLATLVFDVKCGDYIIATIKYNITVKCNFTVIVNGGYWSENRFNDSLHTNFVLTSTNSTPFEAGIECEFQSETDGSDLKLDEKFKGLAYDVYRLNEEKTLGQELVTMSMNKVDGCKLKGVPGAYSLLFTKDFNSELDGEIILTLTINTDIGDYVIEWRINVTPIVEVKNNFANNHKIQNDGAYFVSNTSVNFASNSNNVALFINAREIIEIKINAQYSIAIVSGLTNISNKDLFNLDVSNEAFIAKSKEESTITYDHSNQKAAITLPTVPVSLNGGQPYYITYKFVVEYLGLTGDSETARVFYITYVVSNEQKVETYTTTTANIDGTTTTNYSADVDVTSGKVTDDNKLTIMSWNNSGNEACKELFKVSFAGSTDAEKKQAFNDFVNSLGTVAYARITKTNVDGSKTIFNFELTHDETNGVVTIDLSKGKDKGGNDITTLFNNELIGEFALMNGETKVVTIAPYSSQNPSGFRLCVGNKTLTAKSNKELGKIIYKTSLIEFNGAINNNPVNINTVIVGIGNSPIAGWIEGASGVVEIDVVYATIKIPASDGSNTDYIEYSVKAAKYSGEGESTYYTTEETFYYIHGGDSLYIVDYGSQGTSEDYFRVPYPTTGDKASIDVAKYVKKWCMDNGELKSMPASIVDVEWPSIQDGIEINDTTINITKEFLQQYKLKNPAEQDYTVEGVELSIEGVPATLSAKIVFKLPKSVNYYDVYSEEVNISTWLQCEYAETTLVINSVEIKSQELELYGATVNDGLVTLDADTLTSYLTSNPDKTYYDVTVTIKYTVNGGQEVTAERIIRFNLPEETATT